jgi:hypothetical protein
MKRFAHVVGTGSRVPARVLTNTDLEIIIIESAAGSPGARR